MERQILLASLDRRWKEHLHEMDYLKSGIGLRGFAQKDPITEYRQEGYELFHLMLDTVREETTRYVFYINPHTGATQITRDHTGQRDGVEAFGIKPINPATQKRFLDETETDFPLFFNLDEVDKLLPQKTGGDTPPPVSNTPATVPAGDSKTAENLVLSGPSENPAEVDTTAAATPGTSRFAGVDASVGARETSLRGAQVKYVATEGDSVAEEYRGVAKNAKCPCGSGKKFKRCHGAEIFADRA
jgi:preprotein translocase subunit SecA